MKEAPSEKPVPTSDGWRAGPPESRATPGAAEDWSLRATMEGYVAGIADHGENPYPYRREEAWCWEHGREQGRQHRVRCEVRASLSSLPLPMQVDSILWYSLAEPTPGARSLLESVAGKAT